MTRGWDDGYMQREMDYGLGLETWSDSKAAKAKVVEDPSRKDFSVLRKTVPPRG